MLTSDQREVELDEEQLLYVSEFWMEPLRRTAASLVMCGCVALDTEPIGNAHTASAFLALARADGVEALARKNLVKFRRSLTRSSHVQLIHTSSLACLSSSPKSDFALGHVGHVGTGGFCGQVSTNPTHVTRLQDFTLNVILVTAARGSLTEHKERPLGTRRAQPARRGAARPRAAWTAGATVCAQGEWPLGATARVTVTAAAMPKGPREAPEACAGGAGAAGARGAPIPTTSTPATCPRASFGAVNDANPTRRGTVLP